MTPTPLVQRTPYKGTNSRCWVRFRFEAADGSLHERELVADTGCPCAVILGQVDFTLLRRTAAAPINSNFGPLAGGWFELQMPELGLTQPVRGYGSDSVFQTVQVDCVDFTALVGLPLLRLVEYGGDASAFWVRKPAGVP